MRGDDDDNDRRPLFYLKDVPLYATHVIVLIYVASMFATTLLPFLNAQAALAWLTFDSERVLKGEIWRIFTYGFNNAPSIGFVIDMFMIGWFGWELEKFFGRKTFLRFYAIAYLIQPLLYTLLGLRWPLVFAGETGSFAVFIGFATLYPETPFFFGRLTARWLAVIYVGIYTLIALSNHSWPFLASHWLTTGIAFAVIRYEQGHFILPALRLFRRRPHVADKVLRFPTPAKEIKTASMVEMDALLDKIARSGLSSLTAKERAQLDAGREALLKNKTSGRR